MRTLSRWGMFGISVITASTLFLNTSVFAETDAARAARFSGFFGTNKSATLVWQSETSGDGWPSCFGNSPNMILKMETSTGKIDTLVKMKSGTKWSDPTITWDGTRVVYYDATGYKVHVVNINGTNDVTLAGSYTGSGRCWRSASGKDYVLLTTITPTGTGRKLILQNLDNPADVATILTTTWAPAIGADYCNTGTHWASMSPDSMFVAGDFPDWPKVGYYKIGDAAPKLFGGFPINGSDGEGCWPTIARDNSHLVLYWSGSHESIHRVDVDGGASPADKAIPSAIVAGGEPETMRWGNDVDFVTMIGGNNKLYVLKISTLAFQSVYPDGKFADRNCDVYVHGGTGTINNLSHSRSKASDIQLSISNAGTVFLQGLSDKENVRVHLITPQGRTAVIMNGSNGTLGTINTRLFSSGVALYRVETSTHVIKSGTMLIAN